MRLIIEALSLNYNRYFGFQEYLFNLLTYIKQHRQEVKVEKIIILCKKKDISAFITFEPEFELQSFDVHNSLERYVLLNMLGSKMNLQPNDILLFTNNYSSFRKKCYHILVIHDLLYLRRKYAPNFFFRLQRALFVSKSAKIANKVISISKWVKDDIIENLAVDPSKVVAIYNNFNFDKFEAGKTTDKIRNFCEKKEYFLVVCANAVHKNTITTLSAFERYREMGGNKSLVVLGKLSKDQQMVVDRMSCQVKQSVFNISNISNVDLGYLYKKAFAYISATLFEGLGMPIVEAMYFGLPCIVSDIPVIREVTDNLAIYFNPLEVNQLVDCMLSVKQSLMQSQAQKIAMLNKYNGKNTIGKYVELINEIVQSNE